jgi:hypothetical protein
VPAHGCDLPCGVDEVPCGQVGVAPDRRGPDERIVLNCVAVDLDSEWVAFSRKGEAAFDFIGIAPQTERDEKVPRVGLDGFESDAAEIGFKNGRCCVHHLSLEPETSACVEHRPL